MFRVMEGLYRRDGVKRLDQNNIIYIIIIIIFIIIIINLIGAIQYKELS